mgnify:CR=1 FL=1
MEKTVNTAWYAKKCALGTLVCCGTELVLLMLASALILRGAISEEMANVQRVACVQRGVEHLRGGRGVFGLHDRSEEDKQACDDDGGLRGERVGHDAGDRLFCL